jgi:hypothetical protein
MPGGQHEPPSPPRSHRILTEETCAGTLCFVTTHVHEPPFLSSGDVSPGILLEIIFEQNVINFGAIHKMIFGNHQKGGEVAKFTIQNLKSCFNFANRHNSVLELLCPLPPEWFEGVLVRCTHTTLNDLLDRNIAHRVLAGCFEEVIIQHNVTLHFLMKIKLFHCH